MGPSEAGPSRPAKLAQNVWTLFGDATRVSIDTFLEQFPPPLPEDVKINSLFKRRDLASNGGRIWGYDKLRRSQMQSDRAFLSLARCVARLSSTGLRPNSDSGLTRRRKLVTNALFVLWISTWHLLNRQGRLAKKVCRGLEPRHAQVPSLVHTAAKFDKRGYATVMRLHILANYVEPGTALSFYSPTVMCRTMMCSLMPHAWMH